jgi:hypothetical protein
MDRDQEFDQIMVPDQDLDQDLFPDQDSDQDMDQDLGPNHELLGHNKYALVLVTNFILTLHRPGTGPGLGPISHSR